MITIPFAAMAGAVNFKKIHACLHDDGVIVYPTDTLYGLGGNFYSPVVLEKIDRMKGRGDRPYSVAVSSLAMMEALATDIPDLFRRRMPGLLPGKFTFLFVANPAVDRRLLKNSGLIGIRMPGSAPLLQMIEKLGLPLISTSVNRSGLTPLNDPAKITAAFPEIDLLIDNGILPPSLGSTIVDLSVLPPRLVRPGDEAEKFSAWFPDQAGPAH